MAFPTKLARKVSSFLPEFLQEGIDWFVAAGVGGDSLQHAAHAQVGGSAETVTFATLGLSDMADANYDVIGINQTSGARPITIDPSTKTVKQFASAGGNASDVVTFIVLGRMKGQAAP